MHVPKLAILFVLLMPAVAVHAGENDRGEELFEKRIRPLLARHCYDCHGEVTQENELRLDEAAGLFRGGVSGKAIAPGEPGQSLLIAAVRHTADDLRMPPEEKLTDGEVADLVRWVELGAPHPSGSGNVPQSEPDDWAARREHWAFQPIADPPLPPVNDHQWCRTPIDHFILARLEERELPPAEQADRRTLIRRATYDLTGLPPTPAEIEAFLHDDSPNAFARVVDRLLASPRYGERWGRHWLDVVRYADSNGLDENLAHGNAWRYRDWVIDSLNKDLPLDRFIRQQLAGDLLPAADAEERNRHLIATGFLSLGPKVLAEVDERKMEMDIIDEQIDTVGRAFLGLSLGCARCHDHKFDPVSQRDYYALSGVFKSTHSMDSFTKIARWHEHELHSEAYERAKAEHEEQLAASRAKLDALVAEATAKLQRELGEAAALPAKPEESFSAETCDRLKQLREQIAAVEKQAPQPPTAMGVRDGKPVDVAVHLRGSHQTLGEVAARSIPRGFVGEDPIPVADDQSGRLALANWITSSDHPFTARVIVNRVWRWHFGRGLVETTDNFGRTGAEPSHSALLDHLAVQFSRDWSLKNLHRRIMLSAVYQSSDLGSPELTAADPENRLLGRFSIRRLEAEEIRDSMLLVSGSLDLEAGGPALNVENREFIFDHTSQDNTSYENHRRSVYLPVVRNHLYEAFTLFDYTDASVARSNRPTSTVASQALYLMNSDFVVEASRKLAERVKREAGDDASDQIRLLYRLAYGRDTTDEELSVAKSLLTTPSNPDDESESLPLLCQTALISNEFFYIR